MDLIFSSYNFRFMFTLCSRLEISSASQQPRSPWLHPFSLKGSITNCSFNPSSLCDVSSDDLSGGENIYINDTRLEEMLIIKGAVSKLLSELLKASGCQNSNRNKYRPSVQARSRSHYVISHHITVLNSGTFSAIREPFQKPENL